MKYSHSLIALFFSVQGFAQITEVVSGLSSPYGLAVDTASNLFISESGATNGNKISMMFLNDGVPAVFDLFTTNLNIPTRLKLSEDNYLYVVETGSNEISRANFGGLGLPQMQPYVTTGLTGPIGLDVRGNDLYVGDYGSYAIKKINTGQVPFQTTLLINDLASDIVVDGDFFYYTNPVYGKVSVNTIENPNPVSGDIAVGIVAPSSLLLHNGLLYISDKTQGKIYSIDPYGSSTTPLLIASGLNNPQSMVVFNNHLYIAETGANRIVKLNLNTLSNTQFENNQAFSIAPNPVQNTLRINTNEKIKEASIFDLAGKKLLAPVSADHSIDVSMLPQGIYIIKVVDNNNQIFSSKFVKQ